MDTDDGFSAQRGAGQGRNPYGQDVTPQRGTGGHRSEPVGDAVPPTAAGGRAAARAAARGRGRGAGADAATGPGGHGRKKKKQVSRKRKWMKRVSISTGVFVLVIAVAAFGLYEYLNGNIRHSKLNTSDVNVPKEAPDAFGRTPLNILIIGSDTRSGAGDCALGGGCSDSTGWGNADVEMLMHISADRSNGSVVSVPRDTRVDIPKCTDPKTNKTMPPTNDIITSSLGRGGPGCTVGTWEKLTGIHIDHFMMVDFSGVVKIADALGGVQVCVQQNVKDDYVYTDAQGVVHDEGSHLKLKAGTQDISGQTALEWLRTRHAFGTGGDLGRAQAQHMYMSSLVKKAKSTDLVTDPVKLFSIAKAATEALTVDDGLNSIQDLVNLANTMKRVPANRITMLTMPNLPDPEDPNDHLIAAPDASKIWAMLRSDVAMDKNTNGPDGGAAPAPSTSAPAPAPTTQAPPSLGIDPSTFPVNVVNGTSENGLAGTVATGLTGQGFTQAAADNRPLSRQTTVVYYPTGHDESAGEVADALGIPHSQMQASSAFAHITVEIGKDWPTGSATFNGTGGGSTTPGKAAPSPSSTLVPGDIPSADTNAINAGGPLGCMDVNPAKDSRGVPIYTW